MNRLKNLRKNKKVPEAPAVPEAPEVPDVDELKDAAEEKAGDVQEMAEDAAASAVPGNMRWMMFQMWVASKFSCCLGSPEMPKMGAVEIPDAGDIPVPDTPEIPKIGGLS